MMNTESARRQMVEQQIRTWDVFDADVLNTIGDVSRDQFVPPEWRGCAYADTEVALPRGQCMLRPSIVGRLLQALDLQTDDEVLEIGTGTGYLTTCLAKTAKSVTSIDIHDDFIVEARKKLADAGVNNVTLECMDAMAGLPEGEFDAIAVTAAVGEMDDRFVGALKPGGRLFIVTGESPVMTARLITRGTDDEIASQDLFATDIPELITGNKPAVFSF